MKLKFPQLLGGIAAATHILSHAFYVANYFKQGGFRIPVIDFLFLTWPITFALELVAILIFVFLFKNSIFRYLAVGLFLASRLFYAIYWTNFIDANFGYTFQTFLGWPNWGFIGIYFFGSLFSLTTMILLIVSTVISFIPDSNTSNNSQSISHNTLTPTANVAAPVAAPVRASNASTQIQNIEALGELLAKGLLTQEEFDRKKKEILGFN